jgi:hypothetical protein
VDILLTCLVSLLAAIIGGWIAGRYALLAQKQAAEDQLKRDVEALRRTINSALQAIGTELAALKADFLDRLQQVYDGREDRRERSFQVRGPLSRNYFAVFESSAAILGNQRCLDQPYLPSQVAAARIPNTAGARSNQ